MQEEFTMAKYKGRKLYQAQSLNGPEHYAYESTWAYTIEYPGANNPTPGRFRIRVTKMPAGDFVAMMGGDPSDVEGGESVQGFLEKWSDRGWLHCLDWLGDINSSMETIESDMLKMFESFTTGQPAEKNWNSNFTPPPKPKKKPKKPDLKVIDGDKKDSSDDDLEWI